MIEVTKNAHLECHPRVGASRVVDFALGSDITISHEDASRGSQWRVFFGGGSGREIGGRAGGCKKFNLDPPVMAVEANPHPTMHIERKVMILDSSGGASTK